MKKHLIAAAVASVMAVPAFAQSNVTIYGNLDAGLQNYDNGKDSLTRAANGIISTSLFGLRGSEDLGGGLRANFNLEGGINTADGRVGPGQSTSGSMTAGGTNKIFNREAWVGLSGGFGEVRIGTQDVTRAQDVDVDVSQAALLGLAPRWNATTDQLGEDQEGVIKYLSPNFSGFQFQLGYTTGNINMTAADTTLKQQGGSVAYNSGPLRIVGGVHKANGTTGALDRDLSAFGASYNFGAFSVGAYTSKADVNLAGDVKANSVSAAVPLGNGLSLHGVYQTMKVDNVANGKGSGFTLAVLKSMSKRTRLYAAYASVDNKAGGLMTMHSLNNVVAPAAAGRDPNGFTVGIQHSF